MPHITNIMEKRIHGFGGVCLKNPLVAEVHTQILDKFIYIYVFSCTLKYFKSRKLAIGWPCFHPTTDPDCTDCYENMDSSGEIRVLYLDVFN